MKTIYNFLLAGLVGCGAAMTLSSCDDMLDLKPQGSFTTEQLKDASDDALEGLLASAYAGLESHFIGNNEAFAGPSTNWIFDVRSDDAYKGGGGTGMEENIHLLEVSEISADNVSGLDKWRNNYWAISRVHKAMNMFKEAGKGDSEYMSELKVLRAWFYFDLIRIFNRIPYATEEEDLTTKSNGEYTREEIFGFIKKDLTEAIEVLPAEKSKVGRITRTTAQAILAKVCAFLSDWQGVLTYTNAIINSQQYALFSHFGDMSKIDYNNGSESVFALQCSTYDNYKHANWSNMLNCTYSDGNLYGQGDDFFRASQNLVNAFRTNPSTGLPYLDGTFNKVNVTENYNGTIDPRLDYTVGRIGFPWRGIPYTMGWVREGTYELYGEFSNKKAWPHPDLCGKVVPWGGNSLNFMFIRYADILLLKAEALIETASGSNAATDQGLVEARNLINQIRQRAINSIDGSYQPVDLDFSKADYYLELYPTTGDANLVWTKEYARTALRFERRLELAMEGHRWFDLQRWGNDYLVSTMNTYMTEETALRPYYQDRSVSANEIFLLVPQEEIDNSNGLYKQY